MPPRPAFAFLPCMLHMNDSQSPLRPVTRRLFWPVLYLATVAGLIWWYEFWPAWHAKRQLQGTWRQVKGVPSQPQESLLSIEGNQSWFLYPRQDQWQAVRSRISIKKADNFFTVRRAVGFDYGTTRETEYIVCIKDERIYILRGVAMLAPETTPSVDKFFIEKDPPSAALDAIREYLERQSPSVETEND